MLDPNIHLLLYCVLLAPNSDPSRRYHGSPALVHNLQQPSVDFLVSYLADCGSHHCAVLHAVHPRTTYGRYSVPS